MRIAVAATPGLAIPTLEWLVGSEHDLIRVFTSAPKPSGRGGRLLISDVADWCENSKIECIEVSKVDDLASFLGDIDVVVVIAFGFLLPQHLLDIPSHGFINLHFSALPRWRGAAPVQRAIENGDSHLGITVFALDAGMDTGPIFHSKLFQRDPQMRCSEALAYLASEGVSLIEKTIQDIQSLIPPTLQAESGSSIARKISKAESEIEWQLSASQIHQKILAFYPNPIARTMFRGEILKITESRLVPNDELRLSPGIISVSKNKICIGTADSPLEIISLIPQGKGEMSAADWARGARIEIGEHCG